MTDFQTILLTALIAGLVAGGILGTSHYVMRPLNLHPVYCYAYGCFWVFCGLSGYLYYLTAGNWQLIAGGWLILGLSGAFVAATYLLDWLTSRAGAKAARDEARKDDTDF
jgi:hypothetical protein